MSDKRVLSMPKSHARSSLITHHSLLKKKVKTMNNRNNWHEKIPAKGGIIGALLGVLVSLGLHRSQDKPIKNAGKTALFSGLGFLLGNWIERVLKRDSTSAEAAADEEGTRD